MLTCFYWCGIKFIAKYKTYMSMRACVCVFWYLHNFLNTWKAAACPPDVRASLAGTSQPLQWLEAAAFHFLSLSLSFYSPTLLPLLFLMLSLCHFSIIILYMYIVRSAISSAIKSSSSMKHGTKTTTDINTHTCTCSAHMPLNCLNCCCCWSGIFLLNC